MGRLPGYVIDMLFPPRKLAPQRLLLCPDPGWDAWVASVEEQVRTIRIDDMALDKAQKAHNNAKKCRNRRRKKYWIKVGLKWCKKARRRRC